MGGIAGTAGQEVVLTPIWHAGTLDELPWEDSRPLLWSVRLDNDVTDAMAARAPVDVGDLRDLTHGPDSGPRLLRRRLLKALLAGAASVHPAEVVVVRAAAGGLVVHSPPGWHASVAGRDSICIIGIARVPLGVDIEPINFAPPLWDVMTAEEKGVLHALDEREQIAEWLRRWTAKEAHAKLLGLGLGVDPSLIATAALSGNLLSCSFAGSSACWTKEANGHLQAAAFWSRCGGEASFHHP